MNDMFRYIADTDENGTEYLRMMDTEERAWIVRECTIIRAEEMTDARTQIAKMMDDARTQIADMMDDARTQIESMIDDARDAISDAYEDMRDEMTEDAKDAYTAMDDAIVYPPYDVALNDAFRPRGKQTGTRTYSVNADVLAEMESYISAKYGNTTEDAQCDILSDVVYHADGTEDAYATGIAETMDDAYRAEHCRFVPRGWDVADTSTDAIAQDENVYARIARYTEIVRERMHAYRVYVTTDTGECAFVVQHANMGRATRDASDNARLCAHVVSASVYVWNGTDIEDCVVTYARDERGNVVPYAGNVPVVLRTTRANMSVLNCADRTDAILAMSSATMRTRNTIRGLTNAIRHDARYGKWTDSYRAIRERIGTILSVLLTDENLGTDTRDAIADDWMRTEQRILAIRM